MKNSQTGRHRFQHRLHEIIFEADTRAGRLKGPKMDCTSIPRSIYWAIVTYELSRAGQKEVSTQACPECMSQDHDADAVFCKFCSARLNSDVS